MAQELLSPSTALQRLRHTAYALMALSSECGDNPLSDTLIVFGDSMLDCLDALGETQVPPATLKAERFEETNAHNHEVQT